MERERVPAEDLGKAYIQWRKKKNLYTMRLMLKDGFTDGTLLWRFYRLIKDTVTGKYEQLYHQYWKGKLD